MFDLSETLGRTAWLRLPVWRAGERKTRILIGALIALCVLLALAEYGTIAVQIVQHGPRWVNRMFLFWGWSRFIHQIAPPALIYDPHVLYHFEHSLPGAQPNNLPFAYPPALLLLIWPLGLMGPVTALLAWSAAGLVAYCWANWRPRGGWRLALFGLVAPASLVALYYAQNSLLVAALLIGGFRQAGRRPVLAGMLFGLMAFKPQFGLLVPVALIAARQWRTIAAAAVTMAAMALASVAAFGSACWTRLPAALAGLSDVVARLPVLDHLAPTVTGGMRLVGAGPGAVQAAQIVAALAAATGVWFACWRGLSPLGAAAVMAGSFLATPYAFHYDLPVLTGAVLTLATAGNDRNETYTTPEMVVLIAAVLLPALMLVQPLGLPWGMLVPGAVFALILRRVAARPGDCLARDATGLLPGRA